MVVAMVSVAVEGVRARTGPDPVNPIVGSVTAVEAVAPPTSHSET